MVTIEIRPARPGEAGLVLNFVRELAAYERLTEEVVADEAAIDRALFADSPKAFCDIAEWDGEPVGFALWFLNFSSFRGRSGLYLEDLFVRPAHRGRGIGRALLKKLAERCLAQGWSRLEWTVLDWNQPAIDFYQAHGATLLQDWKICRVSGEALRRLGGDIQ
jgi:GNAT superfamily N-acetyltransferase